MEQSQFSRDRPYIAFICSFWCNLHPFPPCSELWETDYYLNITGFAWPLASCWEALPVREYWLETQVRERWDRGIAPPDRYRVDVLVALHSCDQNIWQKQLIGEKIYYSS
jgi:hypothetical protein